MHVKYPPMILNPVSGKSPTLRTWVYGLRPGDVFWKCSLEPDNRLFPSKLFTLKPHTEIKI